MNYWIKDHRAALLEVLEGAGYSAHHDTDKMLAGNKNLVQRPRAVLALGLGVG